MAQQLSFVVEEQMVSLAGACFWFWNSFYSFLENCGVPKSLYLRWSYFLRQAGGGVKVYSG